MTDVAQYRFLPWTRRGLAAQAGGPDPADGSPLPERARLSVGVTVTGAGRASMDLALYGPGDVLGIDTHLIVRTEPRPNSTDVEPNYLPAVEFDPPDFPWLFTPAAPGADQRLRPWLVLVCLDRAVVEPPHMTSPGGRRRPLPVVELSSAEVATELPDLHESWAWAHTQVATDTASGPVTPAGLDAAPDLTVSRLMCPRRLEAGHRYVACLVPAFDAGVARGLTGEAPPTAADGTTPPIGPAWDVTAPADLVLPVYFHWEFATGPEGDFEELVKRLDPFVCPPTVGTAPMHVGHGGPELPEIDDGRPGATLAMDGALRAPSRTPGTLNEVAQDLRDGLRKALGAPADLAEATGTAQTPVLGPPLYGGGHTRRHRVATTDTSWFAELNLDPRCRTAAGLATEVVRRNQEDLMQAAWEQVGRLDPANDLLNRGRFALEVVRRLYERHLQPLPAHRFLQLTAPMGTRTLLDALTVTATVQRTSLPDAAADPALRRLLGGRQPLLRRAARRAGHPPTAGGAAAPMALVARMARADGVVDPNLADRDGLAGAAGLEELAIPGSGSALVDMAAIGVPLRLPADVLRDGRTRYRAVTRIVAALGEGMSAASVRPRDDLRLTGLLTPEVIRIVGAAPTAGSGTVLGDASLTGVLAAVRDASAGNPEAPALLLDMSGARPRVAALDVDGQGRLVVRTPGTTPSVPVGELAPTLLHADTATMAAAIGSLPAGTLAPLRRPGSVPPVIVTGTSPGGGPQPPASTPPVVPTKTLPAPVRDLAVISRFELAWAGAHRTVTAAPPVPARTAVPFAVTAARTAVLAAIDPATTIPRRLATMLTVAGTSLLTATDDRLAVSGTADRVLAFPELPVPVHQLLAHHAPDRFVPGVDAVPGNSITLLETNPRFVEGFLVGMNHEMNRELLWREYPTDRRGTPFRHFWGWFDGRPDIPPIHTWPAGAALGGTTRGGGGGQLVLLVRGELLRRYPNTSVFAWRAAGSDLKDPPGPDDIVHPVFGGRFDPDMTFYGFPLTETDVADDGWFFVIQEQPTEPRFGFDESPTGTEPGPLDAWPDATWRHTGTDPGSHLLIAGNPLTGTTRTGVTFAVNAAHTAAITLQKPVRVAVRSSRLLPPS
ncbi:hypothetical protein ABZ543_27050 [Streptomyces roseifaciens]